MHKRYSSMWKHLSLLALLLAAGFAAGQDMPLHEIIKPGEDWKPHSGIMPRPATFYTVDASNRQILLNRGTSNNGETLKHPLKEPTCCAVSLGGSTLLVADAADRYVWAFRIEKDGSLGPGDRYCRLRVRGDERRKKDTPADFYKADPSAMTVDGANRAYVATSIGIQVFDPTGRLCGVITGPPGRLTELAFQENRLYAQSGDKVFVRTTFAEGK